MKRFFAFALFLFLWAPLFFLVSAEEAPGIEELPFYNETSQVREGGLDYLKSQWSTFLLSNPLLAQLDSGLSKGNIVFFVLFAYDYEISFKFFLILIFWFSFWGCSFNVIQAYSTFSHWTSWFIGLLSAVIFAHIGFFRLLTVPFMWLLFSEKPWWASLLLGAGLVVGLIFLFRFIKQWSRQMRKKRLADREETALQKVEIGAKFGEGLEKGLSRRDFISGRWK